MSKFLKKTICFIVTTALVLSLFPNLGEVKRVEAAGTAMDIVQVANTEFLNGYVAGANKNNKYGAYFGHNNCDWCAYFVSWCARMAGVSENVIKTNGWAGDLGSFGAPSYLRGQVNPQPGDIVYYNFNGIAGPEHVEIVTEVRTNTIVSVGGNTGGGNGKVGVREISKTSGYIYGYERPSYSSPLAKPTISNVKVYDIDNTGYTVSCTVTSSSPLNRVEFPTWTLKNNQDDLPSKFPEGTKNGNTYTYRVNTSEHNNEEGNYITHIYAWVSDSVYASTSTGVIYIDKTSPVISNPKISNVTSEGFDVSCDVSDNYKLDRVEFPTWTSNNGQDDLIWHKGSINNGVASFHVKRSNHKNEYGKYITDIYLYDSAKNRTTYSSLVVFLEEEKSSDEKTDDDNTPDDNGFFEIPEETNNVVDNSNSDVINTNNNPSTQNSVKPTAVTNSNASSGSASLNTANTANAPKKIIYRNEWVKGLWYDANGNNSYSAKLYWRSNSKGWYVEDSNRWYPQSQWQKINSVWYYFNSSGYMASGEWYNGYWFNTDGSWTYKEKATWKNDGTGWWYGDTSGWYAQNCWQKIDGDWYYFNSSGYMATSQYIGGWWVGADGVCR